MQPGPDEPGSMRGLSSEKLRPKRDPRVSVAKAAVGRLQEMIRDGHLPIGSALPPQRELAQSLNVSRASLREACSILATIGVISIEPGRGTFVRDRLDGQPTPTGVPWRFAERYSPAEVYQFRYVAECHAAQLAAMNHTDEEMEELTRNLELFRRATRELDIATYAQSDFDFHKLIMRFSRNRLLADMHQNFASVLLESQRLPLTRRDRLWEAVMEHERIVEALAMHDPDGAGYYMRRHLSQACNRAGITITELA